MGIIITHGVLPALASARGVSKEHAPGTGETLLLTSEGRPVTDNAGGHWGLSVLEVANGLATF